MLTGFDLTITHERWGDTDDPHKMHKLRYPADINKPLRDAAREKVAKYQSDYANDQRISFLPAAFSTSGRIDAEFLRLLFYHAHRECEDFFRLTGQLAQPNQDYVFSKRAAFFNVSRARLDTSWRRPRHFGSTSISLLLSPLLRAPLHANHTPTSSTPLTSPLHP